jgi:uncharacterized membrane protein
MKGKFIACLVSLACVIMLATPVMAAGSIDTSVVSGTLPFVINNLNVSAIDYYSATISWQTNFPADSQVEYGTNTSYGSTTPLADTTVPVPSHTVQLIGLASGTTYHFSVMSYATINDTPTPVVSNDSSFTTLIGPPTIIPTITLTTTPTTTPAATPVTTPTTTPANTPGTTPTTTATPMTLSQQVTAYYNLTTQSDVILDSQGVSQTAGQIRTTDGNVTLNVAAGTKMLTAQGRSITRVLAILPTSVPPPPPQGAIVATYDFGPSGATFVPPLTMILKYDLANLEPGVSEKTLYIAYWDGTQWQKLASTVDTVNNTVTAQVPHFTDFAILGQIATTTPITTPISTPITTITPPPAPTTQWPLIIGTIVAIIVIGLIIFFLIARKRKNE